MFSSIMKIGIKEIKERYMEAQEVYIDSICKRVRNMKPDIIYTADAFYIPNQDFFRLVFGADIVNPDYDVYDSSGYCDWDGYLVFPIYDVLNDIVGLVGFNPINKLKAKEPEHWDLSYYKHSNTKLMDKSKYIFMLKGMFQKAIEKGYIILTDGVFDMLSGAQEGLVTGALLGSTLSEEMIAQLKFIDIIYMTMDNDEAGLRLLKLLKKYCPNTRAIIQGKFKDLDDILKSEYKEKFLKTLHTNIEGKVNVDVVFR